jgi:hypothetical protein
MIRKLIAIILAIAINCGVLATLNHLSTVSVASAAAPSTHVQKIVTLPTIRVTPTRAQMEQLRRTPAARRRQQRHASHRRCRHAGAGDAVLLVRGRQRGTRRLMRGLSALRAAAVPPVVATRSV